MNARPPRSVPQPPETISPSLLASYSRCPARAGFECDAAWRHLRRTGLRAALGKVAHAALERRWKGQEFRTVWDEETRKVQQELAAEWAPAVPPSPRSWPGWALTRTRVGAAWPAQPAAPGAAPAAPTRAREVGLLKDAAVPGGAHPGPLPWREKWLHDTRTGLAGKPDLVDRVDGAVRVIDFKTGVGQAAATEAQRQQLLFYAGLVKAVLGDLPAVAAVQDASGARHPVVFSRDEVEAVLGRATTALGNLRGAAGGSTILAARPSQEDCSLCPFRIVCGDFLDAYEAEWTCGHVRVGHIVGTSTTDSHGVVDVEVLSPVWARGRMRLVGFPFAQDIAAGQVWAYSDYEGPGTAGIARWNTLVARWLET